jgi:hypothetical protein
MGLQKRECGPGWLDHRRASRFLSHRVAAILMAHSRGGGNPIRVETRVEGEQFVYRHLWQVVVRQCQHRPADYTITFVNRRWNVTLDWSAPLGPGRIRPLV